MSLEQRAAVVTGAGSGIGQATARLLAENGANVVVLDRDEKGAEATARMIQADGGRSLAVKADVSRADDVDQARRVTEASYGPATILVNNAGAAAGDDVVHMEEETWDWNLQAVLKPTFLCSKAFVPGMISRGGGSIVNISSVNALAAYGEDAYSAAKAGILSLTQNMAVRYGPSGVRVNSVCPGTVRTPIFREELQRDPKLFDRLARWYPLGRVGEPDDIAQAVVFLASRCSAWITGTVLVVDGGLSAGHPGLARELLGLGGESC